MKKHLLLISLLAIASLFVSCDGAIMTDIVNSTEKVSKSYGSIIGVSTTQAKVYYRLSSGIYSNVTGGGSETCLVANKENYLVRSSALVTLGGNEYIMYITNNETELNNGTIHFYKLSDGSASTALISGFDGTNTDTIVNMYSNGAVLVQSVDASSNVVYKLYYKLTNEPTSDLIFGGEIAISVDSKTNVSKLYLQSGIESNSSQITDQKAILALNIKTESNGETTYKYAYYKIDLPFSSPTTTTLSSSDEITGNMSKLQIANFSVDNNGNYYAITTGGYVYKAAASSGTFSSITSTGYYYEPDSAFMYRIYDSVNSKNYLITKRSTKNSTLVVYSYDNDASSFSSTTIRYGYAAKIAKDLVCSAYQLTSTDPFNILVATNESGMVSLSINMAYVTSDDSSNGSTTDFEKFEF